MWASISDVGRRLVLGVREGGAMDRFDNPPFFEGLDLRQIYVPPKSYNNLRIPNFF